MPVDLCPLLLREPTGLRPDRGGDAEPPEVVEQRPVLQVAPRPARQAEPGGQGPAGLPEPEAVADGGLVLAPCIRIEKAVRLGSYGTRRPPGGPAAWPPGRAARKPRMRVTPGALARSGRGPAVPRGCYEAQPIMDLWEDLERRIRSRGVRVDERLALLRALQAGEDLAARREALRRAVTEAAERLLAEAAGT